MHLIKERKRCLMNLNFHWMTLRKSSVLCLAAWLIGSMTAGAASSIVAEMTTLAREAACKNDMHFHLFQVRHDHQLLRERIQRLTGAAGVGRMEAALVRTREQVAEEIEEAQSWESDTR